LLPVNPSILLILFREFEETMDTLQNDIDSLEAEKAAVQTKLSNMTKKQMYDSLTKGSSGVGVALGKLDKRQENCQKSCQEWYRN